MAGYTPMIQQYLKIKAEHQDAFLFFRLGDFYEMFFEDAKKASQELEITLTSRDGGAAEKIPMCGVPYHSASAYIEQLIKKGYKVAICEQTEDPKAAKGVVKREVVQLITPGTVMDGKGIHESENNFIASVSACSNGYGLALSDLTTGENLAVLIERLEDVISEIYSVGAREIVVSGSLDADTVAQLRERCGATISIEDGETDEHVTIIEHLNNEDITKTFLRLYTYLKRTQKRSLDHLQPVQVYELEEAMKIDLYSKRNLELTETIRSKNKKGSLLWLLDETKTAMGGRLLKQWIDRPLIRVNQIEERQEMVETLMSHFFEREDLRERLKEVYDLERLAGRVAFGNVNARDLIQLKESLKQVPGIKQLVASLAHDKAKERAKRIDPCGDVLELLEEALYENPPLSVKEGNLIKDGYNQKLDEYRDASRNGKDWIARLEQQEREYTGIRSLKVGFNKVFGYYIEVTKANLHLLEEGRYERKQTLTNAERYITPELKEKEALILEAENNICELEYELFTELREKVKQYIPRLQQLAKQMSELDALQCFATISENRHYTKPEFSKDEVEVIEGRHPVVEKVMDSQEYVPNNCMMGDNRQMLLITGPNMSGKSTYMRQIALISIMAQIGCFVPAKKAVLPIFDQIFTRIGAADDLISGQSTFMVEMLEAKNAIVNATKNSLILFDEIGRGTSTYDGMALAQAIIEYVHDHIGAKTLFSTHYHELTVLEDKLPQLKNVHVRAEEYNGTVVFLHQIKEGAADKSYGIHVAQLAELPGDLIARAQDILKELEHSGNKPEVPVQKPQVKEEPAQLSFFDEAEKPAETPKLSKKEKQVIDAFKSLNILDMTPLEAMNEMYKLQKKLH
ncbi:DNA mismatch repair protein MutS [Bacillus subtilis]|uniref:DNA mismatch repair protein MutS n=7 Tax=Bacilli TaxID=91061 RepID=MUTS_BACSU|nr:MULTISPECIES: DNA mismatch repair protein MutS [Bacillales]NP_389586.2 DNA mismatch repair recognition factor [Bacillus subtilis subsp. subtilis str. 168]P49849.3 RecName: Full=DNA mismatch repair protein MutS [Bacillus subtilis subsp. subtilis str. 168]MBW4826841.1 DNA mismatch repair protein MutS [Bacillaceae bacterium]BAM52350.1 DNA mismatch repair protein MutS [Bacillus subtilis BEST7613]ADV96730.1 DNA mismatch repair protein MutS [Bacillus subtilis BSn5]AFQ57637.1 DNA mismatch repair 